MTVFQFIRAIFFISLSLGFLFTKKPIAHQTPFQHENEIAFHFSNGLALFTLTCAVTSFSALPIANHIFLTITIAYGELFVLKLHPALNVDDKAKDDLTISLPELTWLPWTTHLWEKWGDEIRRADEAEAAGKQKYRDVTDRIHSLRAIHAQGLIAQEEYEREKDELREEQALLYNKYIRSRR